MKNLKNLLLSTFTMIYNALSTKRKIIRTTNLRYTLSRLVFGGVCFACVLLSLRCYKLESRSNTMEVTLTSVLGEDVSTLSNDELIAKSDDVKLKYYTAVNNYTTVSNENEQLNSQLNNILVGIIELDNQNINLITTNKQYKDELTKLRERAELYDKYEYAIEYDGERTDITYDQLKTGIDICKENNIDPNLLFSIIMTESHGIETAKNSESTATGYGQVLQGTAKYVYENLLENGDGTFKSSMLKDGETNIEITATYIAYLRDNTSTVKELIAGYRGENNEEYYNTIVAKLENAGTSVVKVQNLMFNKGK